MEQYKPQTLEENYANIKYLYDIFWNQIYGFIWSYNDITDKYTNISRYYQLLITGASNPYLNTYGDEIRNLAYAISGFTADVFVRVSYAIDCWRIRNDKSHQGRKVTDKQYDQGICLMKHKNKIRGNEKEALLDFRPKRNYYTHYGRLMFCGYVFQECKNIYSLLCVLEKLLSGISMEDKKVKVYLKRQEYFIEEMKDELRKFRIANEDSMQKSIFIEREV